MLESLRAATISRSFSSDRIDLLETRLRRSQDRNNHGSGA
jgi:hypothetical protein